EIVQPNSNQQLDSALNFAQNSRRDGGFIDGEVQRAEPLLQLAQMEIARLGQRLSTDPHEAPRFAQARAAAHRAIIIHQDLLQVLLHSVAAASLLAIPTVVSFDLRNDSLESHLFARVLLALARAERH